MDDNARKIVRDIKRERRKARLLELTEANERAQLAKAPHGADYLRVQMDGFDAEIIARDHYEARVRGWSDYPSEGTAITAATAAEYEAYERALEG